MLERTAASLESCTVQRVLPRSSRAAKGSQKLRTGFWQHGASAIELSNAWPGPPPPLPRSVEPEFFEQQTRPVVPNLTASVFLLDFLYPNIDHSLLKKLYPSIPRLQNGSSRVPLRRRRYSSSAERAKPAEPEQAATPSGFGLDPEQTLLSRKDSRKPPRDDRNEPAFFLKDAPGHGQPMTLVQAAALEAKQDVEQLKDDPGSTDTRALECLLAHSEQEQYEKVWDLYCRLNSTQRAQLRPAVVVYLSMSPNVTETGRATSLLRQVPPEDWNSDFMAAAVMVLIRSGDPWSALYLSKNALTSRGIFGGVGYLLTNAYNQRQWSAVMEIWETCFESGLNSAEKVQSAEDLWKVVKVVPDLGKLYIAFDRHLSSDKTARATLRGASEEWRDAFGAFRWILADMALQQPCEKFHAMFILDRFKRHPRAHRLYDRYICRMFERLYAKEETIASLDHVPIVYKRYRELPDPSPSTEVLRGMFKFYYPHDVAGLEGIYRDWRQFRGELNQWAYEKFLKFYAQAGDVRAVQDLWKRFVSQYPEILQSPRAFRSTMNVYAQVGNVAAAERELRLMREQYGVEPDVDSWNSMLKCYMRVNDYDMMLNCFEHICQNFKPNSFTYAHVMAMCAKKGDLVETLNLAAQAQKSNIAVSKEMILAMVVAYCHNDQVVEAEALCRASAFRKITSAAIWNELIHFHGMQGHAQKCRDLMSEMGQHGVARNSSTYTYYIEALVRVRRVSQAFALLKQARLTKRFKPKPEQYAIVMAGALRTRRYRGMIHMVDNEMRKAGQEPTFVTQVPYAQAAFMSFPSGKRAKAMGQELVTYLKAVLRADEKEDSLMDDLEEPAPPDAAPGELGAIRSQTRNFGRAVTLLVRMRNFDAVEEMLRLYREIFPHTRGQPFPSNVTAALMLGHAQDGDWDRVKIQFDQYWEAMMSKARKADGDGVLPAHEYDLCRLVNVMIDMFAETRNKQGLGSLISRITSTGFKLTKTNWDKAIRTSVDLAQWYQAMHWCETYLMPRFVVGETPPLVADKRTEFVNTRILKAPLATVRVLQEHWLELRKASAWSADIAQELRDIDANYPLLSKAFNEVLHSSDVQEQDGTTTATTSKDAYVSSDDPAPIDELLRPLSLTELRDLRLGILQQFGEERGEEQGVIPMHIAEKKILQGGEAVEDGGWGDARGRLRARRGLESMKRAMKKPDLKQIRRALLADIKMERSREDREESG